MSTITEPARPASAGDEELIVRTEGVAGHLSLNRPQAIHALTLGMCNAMLAALRGWEHDPAITAVLLDHAAGRGLCSGGDITVLRRSALEDGGASGRTFFADEYRLNHALFNYAKPIVAFMDGIVMGGGVGITQPARLRVATENTRLAMPETAIGLFPDVGGGWFLSRLRGRLGQYLGLTGARIDGADCLWAGLATHYLPAAALPEAKARIIAGEPPEAVLASLAIEPPASRLAAQAADIDRLFAADTLEGVLAALAADPGEWAAQQRKTIAAMSPLSAKVTLRQLVEGAAMPDFTANMAMEYRIACRMLAQPDFAEGVRAVLVDKDHSARWNPATPAGVGDDLLDRIFAPLPSGEEWSPR